jgi:tetratricopeptide (TPR) repeat protein
LSELEQLGRAAEEAYRRNDLSACEKIARRILSTSPRNLDATVMMGVVAARRGNAPAAIQYLRNALAIDPESTAARVALSTQLMRTGKLDEAIANAREAARSAPGDLDLQANLGLCLANAGRFDDAAETFRAIVEKQPDRIGAWQNLAASLADGGYETQAIAAWTKVVELDPALLRGWLGLGQLQMAHGQFAAAQECGERAVAIDPNSVAARLFLGLALSELKITSKAEAHLRRALELEPGHPIANASLGFWLQEQGRFEEAEPLLLAAIRSQPEHGFAYYNLFRARKATEEDAEILSQAESLSERARSPRDRSYLHYALGKATEDMQDFAAAWKHYRTANELAYNIWFGQKPWDKEAYSQEIDKTMATFDREGLHALSGAAEPSERPIFIVGMIRSGTSLLEQILSSHPSVAGAGELPFWHEQQERAFLDGAPDPDRLKALAAEYLAELSELDASALRITDKLPHNYAMLGSIHSALPNAKIIHLTRNPRDNCLSIYTTAYQRPPSFAHSQANIVYEFREYERLMAHWRSVLPRDAMLEVRYEDLVADRERMARQIVSFVGLDWSDACLSHEQNRRSVRTPSLWQVRQPIYKTSIERWRKFEPWLGELAGLPVGS